MPDSEVNFVSNEWLQSELRSGVASRDLIVLDCRSSQDYSTGHVRSAANFSIPSIMLRRLAAGKIELTAAIKCRDLKNSQFVLYNDGQQVPVSTKSPFNASDVISVLYRRLKEDDCRVAFLRGKSQRTSGQASDSPQDGDKSRWNNQTRTTNKQKKTGRSTPTRAH